MPFTGQTFGVLLVGGALGFRRGARRALLYLAIGAIGAAGLRGGSSPASAIVQGVTGGYLIGFVVAAALVGRLAELGWDRRIGGALGDDGHRHRDHLRHRRALAEGHHRHAVADRGR